jgi:hypothetical protein
MNDVFVDMLNRELDSVCPGVSNRRNRLDELPDLVQQDVVTRLLSRACQSQNDANIVLARQAIAAIPQPCISRVLERSIRRGVDLADEWEFRRLLELLREINSDQLSALITFGLASNDADIREAAEDFKAL